MLLTTPRLLSPSLTDYDSSQLTPRLSRHSAPSLTTPCLTLASDGPAVAGMLAGSSHSALTPHTDDCDTLRPLILTTSQHVHLVAPATL